MGKWCTVKFFEQFLLQKNPKQTYKITHAVRLLAGKQNDFKPAQSPELTVTAVSCV